VLNRWETGRIEPVAVDIQPHPLRPGDRGGNARHDCGSVEAYRLRAVGSGEVARHLFRGRHQVAVAQIDDRRPPVRVADKVAVRQSSFTIRPVLDVEMGIDL